MVGLIFLRNSADAAFLNPLFAGAGNWANQKQRPAIASLRINDHDVYRKVFATQHAGLSDVQRQRTGVLFGCLHDVQSEIEFERELNNPGVRRRKNLAECGGLTPDIRRAEICMIESIEKLGSELEVTILIDVDFLRNREVEIREPRAAHDPNSSAPKCLRRGTQCGKRIGVEPTLDGSLRRWQLRIRNEVWPRHAIAAEIQSAAATENGGQWEPALQDMDPGDLPVSEEQTDWLRP